MYQDISILHRRQMILIKYVSMGCVKCLSVYQKTRKPLRHKAFSLASFEIKVGKKWADGQFFTVFPSVQG
jgi:hypothetical protein